MTRGIGLWGAMGLVISSMIGTGVFTTSGHALASLKDPDYVMLAWAVGGVVALAGAMSYAALGLQYKESGGEYLILAKALHPLAGFLAGWVSLWAGFTAPTAITAHAFEAYLGLEGYFWPGASVIILSGLLHGLSRSKGMSFQVLSVGLKVLAIFFFFFLVFFSEAIGPVSAAQKETFSGPGNFLVALLWISFSYAGWGAPIYINGELKRPEKDLMRSSVIGVAVVSLIYLILNGIFLYCVPGHLISGETEVGLITGAFLGGEKLKNIVSLIVALGLITSISSMVMLGPRIYTQMAADGVFPKIFNLRSSIVLQVVLALVAYSFSTLSDLMSYSGYLLGLSSAMTVSVIFLKKSGLARKKLPGYPISPLIFISVSLLSVFFFGLKNPQGLFVGLGTLALGVLVYFVFQRGATKPSLDLSEDSPLIPSATFIPAPFQATSRSHEEIDDEGGIHPESFPPAEEIKETEYSIASQKKKDSSDSLHGDGA